MSHSASRVLTRPAQGRGGYPFLVNILLFFGVLNCLFVSPSTAKALGVDLGDTFANMILVGPILAGILSLGFFDYFAKAKYELYIIGLGLAIALLQGYAFGFMGVKLATLFFILPALLSALLRESSAGALFAVRAAIIIFFVCETLLGITERILSIHVFPMVSEKGMENAANAVNEWQFRSTAFRGHPLANALTVSTIAGYILITDKLGASAKVVLIGLGLFSLFCFNARASILAWVLLMSITYVRYLYQKKFNPVLTLSSLMVLPLIVAFSYFYLADSGLGGRILNQEIMDGSAVTRLNVLEAFDYIPTFDLWYGNYQNYMPVTYALGAGGIENSLIVLIVRYGLVMTAFVVAIYFFWMRSLLRELSWYSWGVVILSYFLLGMTNNNLAGHFYWVLFVLCHFAFKPDTETNSSSGSVGNG